MVALLCTSSFAFPHYYPYDKSDSPVKFMTQLKDTMSSNKLRIKL